MKNSETQFKPMDVAYVDCFRNPQRLVVEVKPEYPASYYTMISDGFGECYRSKNAVRTREEWLVWLERFSDDLTGRELRECREAVMAPFEEPKVWGEFRKRFAETGDAFLK